LATNKDFIVKNGLSVGGDVAITGNVTSDLHLNDNAKIKVGTATDGDLQIYHNVNNSFIEDVGTGSLYLRADASVRIQSYGDNNDMIKADKAGAVTLYHNNGSRLDTTASGVNVTGTVDMDGFTSVGNGTITGDVLIQKGSGFPRIILQDLDGTNTRAFIQYSANTLHLTSQNNTANGRIVFSRYNGTTTTTSGYFDATGKLFTSSDLDVSGNVVSSGNISAVNTTLTGYLRGPASFTIDPAAHADNTGTVIIAGNLQVDGTQTTINSTSLTVDDLNITLASGAADSAAANGAGITIDGAGASLTYAHSDTKFVFNKPLDVTGNIGVTGTVDGIDIAARDGVLTSTTTTAGAALPKAGGTMTGILQLNNAVELRTLDTGGNARTIVRANSSNELEFGWSANAPVKFMGGGSYTERMRIHTNGNVGIGTTGPLSTLSVADDNSFGGANGQIVFSITPSVSNTESAGMAFGTYNDNDYWKQGIFWKRTGSYGRGELHFANRAAADSTTVSISDSKMMIDDAGNVGIGTTSPGHKLDVEGGANVFDLARFGSSASDNSEITIGYFDANANNGIPAVITASDFGGLIQGGENGHLVLGIRDNDATDALDIVSGGGNFMTDTTYDTLVATFKANGNVGIGINNPSQIFHVQKAADDKLVYGSNPRLLLDTPTGINGLRVLGDTTPFEFKIDSGTYNGSTFQMGGTGDLSFIGTTTTASDTFNDSPTFFFNSQRWNGSANSTHFQGAIKGHTRSATNGDGYLGIGANASANHLNIDASTGNVGIRTTDPKANLHVNVTGNSDGFLAGGKNLSLNASYQTGAQLEVTLGNHQGCYVKVFITGDWSGHSAMAFLGEYFIQNGANAYAEPGMIIREVENTNGIDSISSRIFDGGDYDSFQIQFKLNVPSGGVTSAAGNLTYQIMGQFDAVS
jgi:hypothetical protein